ncbi:MAG: hypothetical protein HPY50_10355 [Firmicutes bacterium]|nr:hypothetical protein [Bacillota bacterium]
MEASSLEGKIEETTDRIAAININIAKIFPGWPETDEARKDVLRGIEALMLEHEFDIPEGHVVEVADGSSVFETYHPGIKTGMIAYEVKSSNPTWWNGVPQLILRPVTIKDEQQFRIRITVGSEVEEFVVRNAQEAVSQFEFMLWETKAMPDYKNLTVQDEQTFKRTGELRHGEGENAPLLEVLR